MRKLLLSFSLLVFIVLQGMAQSLSPVYPAHRQVIHCDSLKLIWNSHSNACKYHVQIASDSLFSNIVFTDTAIINTQISGPILPRGYYWFRVRSNCNQVFSNWGRQSKFGVYRTLPSDSLKLRLDPSVGITKDANNRVSVWANQVSSLYNATQSNVNLAPVLTQLQAKKPMLYFDGADDYMISGNVPYTELTLVVAYRFQTHTTNKAIFSKFTIGSWNTGFMYSALFDGQHARIGVSSNFTDYYGKANSNNLSYVDALRISSLGRQFYRSGSPSANPASAVNMSYNNGNICIGTHWVGSGGWYYKGGIGDIMFFSKSLPDSVIKLTSDYIQHSYNPPVNLGPDRRITYGFCKDTLDANEKYISYQWSNGDTNRRIAVWAGKYWCKVKDIFGSYHTDTIILTDLVPQLSYSDTTFCIGDTISLSVNSFFSKPQYQFLWNTADTSRTMRFNHAATHWVKVTDSLGCFRTDTFQLKLDSFPVKADLGPNITFCAGNQIGLIAGANQAIHYLWSTTDTTAMLTVQTPGTFKLTVTNGRGCIAHDSIHVSIKGIAPLPRFFADSTCNKTPVIFTDSSLSLDGRPIVLWQWEFGDTTTSSVQNPVHLYPQSGNYQVKLTVTTDSGCAKSIIKPLFIRSLPVPKFTPFMGCEKVAVQFNNNSIPGSDPIIQYSWKFGDPQSGTSDTSSQFQPSHTYQLEGQYPVKLVLTSWAGCKDSISKDVSIKPSPSPDFLYNTTCLGDTTFFTDNTSTPVYSPITSWLWDFGHGSPSSQTNPQHFYPQPGLYQVQLTVKALNGCEFSTEKTIKIHENPVAGFTNQIQCINLPVVFTDTSKVNNDNITSWLWISGNQIFSNQQNPQRHFQDTLIYPITLIVETNAGCKDTISKSLKIHPAPASAFTMFPDNGLPPLNVQFTNMSFGANQFKWSFGDGDSSNLVNPSKVYTDSGLYQVHLVALTPYGCSDTSSSTVFVVYLPVDITIKNIYPSISNNKLTFVAELVNQSVRKITQLDLTARINEGSAITETWSGLLQTGQTLLYTFHAKYDLDAGLPSQFICIDVKIPGIKSDDHPENDHYCIAFNNTFFVSQPFPNPATDKFGLDIILPAAGNIEIQLFSEIGESMGTVYSGYNRAGLNRFSLPLENLRKGFYIYKIIYKDQIIIKKLIKL